MISRLLPGLAAVLICSGPIGAQQAHHENDGPALLPDPTVTTGGVPLSNRDTVCTTKWGEDERHVIVKMKKERTKNTAPRRAVESASTKRG